jgi:phosphatidylinositol glycan class K
MTLCVKVASSRYWFNYRHLSNILVVYQFVRKMGISDSNIIVMNALDDVCGVKNSFPGEIFSDPYLSNEVCKDVQFDYVGGDVTVSNFLRLLTGRHPAGTPLFKQLRTNRESNVLIFLSGHGGDGFFKFRDTEEVTTAELRTSLTEMQQQRRFKNMLIIADTCQAATLTSDVNITGVISMGSSKKGQNSYSFLPNDLLGANTIDRFSYMLGEYFNRKIKSPADLKKTSLGNLVRSMDSGFLYSDAFLAGLLSNGKVGGRDIPLGLFFGSEKAVSSNVSTNRTPITCLETPSATESGNFETKTVSSEEEHALNNSPSVGEVKNRQSPRHSFAFILEQGLRSIQESIAAVPLISVLCALFLLLAYL